MKELALGERPAAQRPGRPRAGPQWVEYPSGAPEGPGNHPRRV